MNSITKNQIITIHTLLQKSGLIDEKARIITEASGGRCSSTSDLFFEEAQNLINFLNASKRDKEDPRKKMIGNIIAMAHEIGMVREVSVVNGDGFLKKKDYSYLHNWVEKFGYLHKGLNNYKYEELPTLVTQFKNLYKSKMNLKF